MPCCAVCVTSPWSKGEGHIDLDITRFALTALNIDSRGLDQMDNKILSTIMKNSAAAPSD